MSDDYEYLPMPAEKHGLLLRIRNAVLLWLAGRDCVLINANISGTLTLPPLSRSLVTGVVINGPGGVAA